MTASGAVTRVLDEHGIAYEVLPHPSVDTALAEARVLRIPPQEVAKTVILARPGGYVRAVLPASERLDMHKVRDALDGEPLVRLATEDEIRTEYPEFELGAVPPFGGRGGDAVLVDARLRRRETVVMEAGAGDTSVRLRMGDLLGLLDQPLVVDICADDHR